MHPIRVIGLVLVLDGRCVQSRSFKQFLPVGSPLVAIDYFNRWGADEIVLLDIGSSRGRPTDLSALLPQAAKFCQCPIAVGGGVRSVEDVARLIRHGADKVVLCSALEDDHGLLPEAAQLFGNQSLVVSVDVRSVDGVWRVAMEHGTRLLAPSPGEWARRMVAAGAGEILVHGIEQDGMGRGFACDVVAEIVRAVEVPVIAAGGAGAPGDMARVLGESGAGAVAAGNYFHFTEHAITCTKAALRRAGFPVRIDSAADYADATFDDMGRLQKKSDDFLGHLRFRHYEEEVI